MPLPKKLTTEQVIEARKRYYYDLWTYKEIAIVYKVSLNTIKAAIRGERGYAKIEDDISDLAKQDRQPYREVWASDAAQRRKGRRQDQKLIGQLNNMRQVNETMAPRRKW